MPAGRVTPGKIVHRSAGRPTRRPTAAASCTTSTRDRIALGYVIGLDYRDPKYQPCEAFQQWKNHPTVKPLLEGGTILSAGARAIVTGGYQSLPKVEMPGALLIGDTAGLLNVPKIKGTHQAIRSGMLAAEHLAATRRAGGFRREAARLAVDGRAAQGPQHQAGLQEGPVVRPAQRGVGNGDDGPVAVDAEEQGRTGPRWTSCRRARDAEARLRRAHARAARPPRRRVLRRHRARRRPAGAPARADTDICITRCAEEYDNPCTRFCPAAVYETAASRDRPNSRTTTTPPARIADTSSTSIGSVNASTASVTVIVTAATPSRANPMLTHCEIAERSPRNRNRMAPLLRRFSSAAGVRASFSYMVFRNRCT